MLNEDGTFDLGTEEGRVGFIRQRANLMSNAKSVVDNKVQLQKQIYEVFEKHLMNGPDAPWNQAYRFPEVFGAVQRKYSDLLDNLPEVKLHSTKTRAKDFTIAAQAAYDQQERLSNSVMEKARAILGTVCYGTGILYEGYGQYINSVIPTEHDELLEYKASKKKPVVLYDGLITENVDIRDFYVDETAYVFYDETGIKGAADCIRRRMYSPQAWAEKILPNKAFKNTADVQPVAYGVSMITTGKIPFPKEAQEQKTSSLYYEVLEYWNKAKDMLVLVCNNIEIYVGANPFKHKRLPFVLYYNYRRDDSIWGVSEVEVVVPFIQAEEDINNLMIMDAKIKLQPAIAVAGDAGFNEEEQELQPGAVFNLRGVINGKVSDAIMPLSFGGIDPNSGSIIERIENSRIAITGDDTRALYSNPGQLATQTLAKRDAAQKRIKSNVFQNTMDSERQRASMRFSNIVQFICKPYLSSTGRVQFRRIAVNDFAVRQDSDEAKPYFSQKYGARSVFSLNEKTFKDMDDTIEIEVIDTQLQEQLKDKELDDMLRFLEITMKFPQAAQGMNVTGLMKQLAKKINLDYYEVFPDAQSTDNTDPVELMIDLLVMGIEPKYAGEMDPEIILQRLLDFKRTSMYKKLPKETKDLFLKFTTNVTSHVPAHLERRLAALLSAAQLTESQSLGAAFPPATPGTPGLPQQALPVGSGGTPTQNQGELIPGAGTIESRMGFGQSRPA